MSAHSAQAYAHAYANRGWYVFPLWWINDEQRCACGGMDNCKPGKHPIGVCAPRGVLDATIYHPVVERWWTKFPRANIALATGRSGILAADLDFNHGADEQAFIAKVGAVETVRVLTGGGGLHLWFKAPPGNYAPSVGKFLPGVDIRAGNSYVLVEPSNHVSGGYKFEVGYRPDEIEIAPCPQVLADFARIVADVSSNGAGPSDAGDQSTGFDILRALAGVPEGERNDTIFRAACHFRGTNAARRVAEAACVDAARKCDPPYPESEAREMVARIYKKYPAGGSAKSKAKADKKPDLDIKSELHLADNLLAAHRDDIFYSPGLGFFIWDGRRYRRDETEQTQKLAQDEVRKLYAQAAKDLAEAALKSTPKPVAQELESRAKIALELAEEMSRHNRVEGALKFARPHVALTADELDAAAHLLNVRNGTVDLRTSELQPHSHADRITKLADVNYVKDAKAPHWHKFLSEIFKDDAALCAYVKRAVGYSITAEQKEKRFWFNWGPNDTGKTTFFNLMRATLGEYAQTVPVSLFLKDRDKIPSDIARLRGVRFACASETAQGKSFDAEKLKWLSGNEGRLVARFMYRELFEFLPTHHLWLASNYKPHARADDGALWVRLVLVPFVVIFEEPTEEKPEPQHRMNKNLEGILSTEREGILTWAIEGAREWYEQGLQEPKAVKDAGSEYRNEEDSLKQFVTKVVLSSNLGGILKSDMWRAYQFFMEGQKHLGKQHFNATLKNQYGFVDSNDEREWLNTTLKEGALPPKNREAKFDF